MTESTPLASSNPVDSVNSAASTWADEISGMPPPVTLSEAAVAKIMDLLAEEGNPNLKLRVFVQGGGCSGFQYGFMFDEIPNEDDTVVSEAGVSLLIDAMSLQYLQGAQVDYKEELMGSQFVIHNPNATASCGCGSSFSV